MKIILNNKTYNGNLYLNDYLINTYINYKLKINELKRNNQQIEIIFNSMAK